MSDAMADRGLRRQPSQVRGQQRIAAILDAAERLFATAGYEASSTNQIAAEAHTAIGSLYQFFPNKEAILNALVARHQARMREALERAFASADPRDELPTGEILDRVLDPVVALYARGHHLLALVLTLPRAGPGAQAGQPLVEEVVRQVEARVARRVSGVDAERRELAARMIVETVRALLPLTVAADGQVRPEAVAEIKRLLRAYIEAALEARNARA